MERLRSPTHPKPTFTKTQANAGYGEMMRKLDKLVAFYFPKVTRA